MLYSLSNLLVHLAAVLRKRRRRSKVMRQRRPDELQKWEFRRSRSSKVRDCSWATVLVRNPAQKVLTQCVCVCCVETLLCQDQRICNSLEEKLQLYAELTELTLRSPEAVPHCHLLVQHETDSETPRQASTLLTAALREGEKAAVVLHISRYQQISVDI